MALTGINLELSHPVVFIELLSSMAIRPIQQHKCSKINLFLIYARHVSAVSAIIRRYYKNIKGETGKTKEEASPFTILFKPELIIFISKNYKIFLLLFTVFTH